MIHVMYPLTNRKPVDVAEKVVIITISWRHLFGICRDSNEHTNQGT